MIEAVALDMNAKETYVVSYENSSDYTIDHLKNDPQMHFTSIFYFHGLAEREAKRVARFSPGWEYNKNRNLIKEDTK